MSGSSPTTAYEKESTRRYREKVEYLTRRTTVCLIRHGELVPVKSHIGRVKAKAGEWLKKKIKLSPPEHLGRGRQANTRRKLDTLCYGSRPDRRAPPDSRLDAVGER